MNQDQSKIIKSVARAISNLAGRAELPSMGGQEGPIPFAEWLKDHFDRYAQAAQQEPLEPEFVTLEHETAFLEIPTDEAIWMRYAAANAANGNTPHSTAYNADQLLRLHRTRWPNSYREEA